MYQYKKEGINSTFQLKLEIRPQAQAALSPEFLFSAPVSSNSEQSEMGKDFFSAHKIEKEDIGKEAAVQIRYGPQGKGGGEGTVCHRTV